MRSHTQARSSSFFQASFTTSNLKLDMLAPILEQGCSESINPQMHESYMDTVSNHYVILCIHILDIQLQANNALKTNHQRPSTQLIKVATSVGNDGN